MFLYTSSSSTHPSLKYTHGSCPVHTPPRRPVHNALQSLDGARSRTRRHEAMARSDGTMSRRGVYRTGEVHRTGGVCTGPERSVYWTREECVLDGRKCSGPEGCVVYRAGVVVYRTAGLCTGRERCVHDCRSLCTGREVCVYETGGVCTRRERLVYKTGGVCTERGDGLQDDRGVYRTGGVCTRLGVYSRGVYGT